MLEKINFKKLLLIFSALLIFLPGTYNASNYDYAIKSYDVNVNINKNNTYDITETINAVFNTQKHGIIRNIPLSNTIVRNDGTTSKNHATVSNVEVNNKFSTSVSSKGYSIKIGDPDRYADQQTTYIIKYSYDIGNDPVKGMDEFYLNLVGSEWDCPIYKTTFAITFPEPLENIDSVGFTAGYHGSTSREGIIITDKGDNYIKGEYTKILSPGESLTTRVELPEGYFETNINFLAYGMIGGMILAMIVAAIILIKDKQSYDIVDTVEFFPPNDINSLEAGALFDLSADSDDVISLLFYLANKGYINIEEDVFDKRNYKLIKVKDYDGSNELEKTFMEGLFSGAEEVEKREVEGRFYRTISQLQTMANASLKPYLKAHGKEYWILFLFNFVILMGFFLRCGISVSSLKFLVTIPVSLFLSMGITTSTSVPITIWINIQFKVMMIIFAVVLMKPDAVSLLFINGLESFITILSVVSVCIMSICMSLLNRRNEEGLRIKGQLNGFKEFLVTAEKEKLEELVEDDPSYFFDILPFTYALGVSEKWVRKFEGLKIEPPEWYSGNNALGAIFIADSIEDSMKTSYEAHNSSSSGGSGGSGGGSSGGGSGGGGGSSW